MFGNITLAAALVVSGVAFAQKTQQPSSTSNVQTQPANGVPRECWDTHTIEHVPLQLQIPGRSRKAHFRLRAPPMALRRAPRPIGPPKMPQCD